MLYNTPDVPKDEHEPTYIIMMVRSIVINGFISGCFVASIIRDNNVNIELQTHLFTWTRELNHERNSIVTMKITMSLFYGDL